MTEAALRRTVKRELGPYGLLVRVEDGCSSGVPDVCYTLHYGPLQATGWLELKHLAKWPVRGRTPLRIPSLTREQVMWHEAWHKAGGRVHTLLQVDADYLLFASEATRELFERRVMSAQVSWKAHATVVGIGTFPTVEMLKALVHD